MEIKMQFRGGYNLCILSVSLFFWLYEKSFIHLQTCWYAVRMLLLGYIGLKALNHITWFESTKPYYQGHWSLHVQTLLMKCAWKLYFTEKRLYCPIDISFWWNIYWQKLNLPILSFKILHKHMLISTIQFHAVFRISMRGN